jgi:hypothetical protein
MAQTKRGKSTRHLNIRLQINPAHDPSIRKNISLVEPHRRLLVAPATAALLFMRRQPPICMESLWADWRLSLAKLGAPNYAWYFVSM